MLELVYVRIGKFVKNINEKRKTLIKGVVHQTFLVNSSVKNMCIRFITIRRIPKMECFCQKLQRSLRYLWVNSVQVAHEGASFVNIRGKLEQKMGGEFDFHPAITERI